MNSRTHTPLESKAVDLTGGHFDAVLFDLDGVLTDTAARTRGQLEEDVRRLPAAARRNDR